MRIANAWYRAFFCPCSNRSVKLPERGENEGEKDHIGDEDDEEMDWGSKETCEEWEPESQRKNRTKNEYEVKKMLNE